MPNEAPESTEEREPMLKFFTYDHLTHPDLRETSKLFAQLAETLVARLPRTSERTVALRKILEGKDAAVRAVVTNGVNE
jgi:hypothetical protein